LDEWRDSFEAIDQQSIMDVFMDHVTDYRVQRRTRPRLDQSRWFCLPVYPYMDECLNTTYRSLPLAHLDAERAHLGLLADYGVGLEDLPTAAHSILRLSISKEYRYRHVIHLFRTLRRNLFRPIRSTLREAKGFLGLGHSLFSQRRETELFALKTSRLFSWPALETLITQAQTGRFVNGQAITNLLNMAFIDDFLFDSNPEANSRLRFVETPRQIQFVQYVRPQRKCS
jgi:hypothetical protein